MRNARAAAATEIAPRTGCDHAKTLVSEWWLERLGMNLALRGG